MPKRKAEKISKEDNPHPSTLHIIDPDGDVHIICEKPMPRKRSKRVDADKKSTFQVSSKTLSLASPVFRKMFEHGSRFAQLKNDAGKRLVEVEADYEVVLAAMDNLHFSRKKPKSDPSLPFLQNLAMFADEYDLADAMSGQVNLWLSKNKAMWGDGSFDRELLNDLGTWLLIAYVFKIEWFSNQLTKRIMLEAVWKNEPEDTDHDNWVMYIAKDAKSMRPTRKVSIPDRVPKAVVENLRTSGLQIRSRFLDIVHPFVKQHYLDQHALRITCIDSPGPKMSANDAFNATYHHLGVLIRAGLWGQFIATADLWPEVPGMPNEGQRGDTDLVLYFSLRSVPHESLLGCTKSAMGSSLQRFLDGVDCFKCQYEAAKRYFSTDREGIKGRFLDVVEKAKNDMVGLDI